MRLAVPRRWEVEQQRHLEDPPEGGDHFKKRIEENSNQAIAGRSKDIFEQTGWNIDYNIAKGTANQASA